jgi:hypothetical protein
MSQIRSSKKIAETGVGRDGINIGSATLRRDAIAMHGTKINTETRFPGSIWHCGVHLGTGKDQNASGRKNHANLRVNLHGFLRHWLDAGVFANVLGGVEPANAVPLRVTVDSGTVQSRWVAASTRTNWPWKRLRRRTSSDTATSQKMLCMRFSRTANAERDIPGS